MNIFKFVSILFFIFFLSVSSVSANETYKKYGKGKTINIKTKINKKKVLVSLKTPFSLQAAKSFYVSKMTINGKKYSKKVPKLKIKINDCSAEISDSFYWGTDIFKPTGVFAKDKYDVKFKGKNKLNTRWISFYNSFFEQTKFYVTNTKLVSKSSDNQTMHGVSITGDCSDEQKLQLTKNIILKVK